LQSGLSTKRSTRAACRARHGTQHTAPRNAWSVANLPILVVGLEGTNTKAVASNVGVEVVVVNIVMTLKVGLEPIKGGNV